MGLLIIGTLAVMAVVVIVGVTVGIRHAEREADPKLASFDNVDRVWMQNTVVMPELVPMPAARRTTIINNSGRTITGG